MILKEELVYLLHVWRTDTKYIRSSEPINTVIKNLINSPQMHTYNERVLIVLIESGYI